VKEWGQKIAYKQGGAQNRPINSLIQKGKSIYSKKEVNPTISGVVSVELTQISLELKEEEAQTTGEIER